jgi:DNA invertase Pin-like site-specific DNA recombinase
MPSIRCALYARVSTTDQHTDNQIAELRQYCGSHGWTLTREYVDHGVSGAKERRPALDELVRDAKRRRFDTLICWRLDRLGRNLRHLVLLLEELQALGISFVSLGEGIDATTPAGRLQMHLLAALSEFERGRIQERVRAGLARARANGKRLGARIAQGLGPAPDRAPTGSSEKSSLANRLRQLSAEVLDQHQVALGADNSWIDDRLAEIENVSRPSCFYLRAAGQLRTKVMGSPPVPAGSMTRNFLPSAVTSYCGTLGDGLRRVWNSARGMPDIGGTSPVMSAAIIIPSAAR